MNEKWFFYNRWNTVKEINTQIIDIINRTSKINSYRCKSDNGIKFIAGQFMRVTLFFKGREEIRHLTISNSPTEKGYYEFTKKITNSNFSKALERLKVGDHVLIKLPFGSFTVNLDNTKIAFLSGGIGITPIISMCKYMNDIKSKNNIILIYGNRTEQDIAFKDELDDIQRNNKNFKIVYTLDFKDNLQWQGRFGLINKKMIVEEIPDYLERCFYICGSRQMVNSMENILKKLNVSNDDIKKENFY